MGLTLKQWFYNSTFDGVFLGVMNVLYLLIGIGLVNSITRNIVMVICLVVIPAVILETVYMYWACVKEE